MYSANAFSTTINFKTTTIAYSVSALVISLALSLCLFAAIFYYVYVFWYFHLRFVILNRRNNLDESVLTEYKLKKATNICYFHYNSKQNKLL